VLSEAIFARTIGCARASHVRWPTRRHREARDITLHAVAAQCDSPALSRHDQSP
jgi:hypothetical protein